MNKTQKLKQEMLNDLIEILNNLSDDITMDLENGESGYLTYKDSHEAIKKYTLKVVKKKIKKWR
jgi:hypothetical protein